MSSAHLKELRALTPYTQAGFAAKMGVPLRTYEDLETGRTAVRPVHINAAKWAVVVCAAEESVFETTLPDDMTEVLRAAIR